MHTLAKLIAAAAIGSSALTALGKTNPDADLEGAQVRPLTTHEAMSLRAVQWSNGCVTGTKTTAALTRARSDLDFAGAVLIANGEFYHGQTVQDIRAAIALMPKWDGADGISKSEEVALARVVKLGRQLAYAEAVEAIEMGLGARPGAVMVADARNGITPEILEAIKPAC